MPLAFVPIIVVVSVCEFVLWLAIAVGAELLTLVSLKRRTSRSTFLVAATAVSFLMTALLGAPIGAVTGNAVAAGASISLMMGVGIVFTLGTVRAPTE